MSRPARHLLPLLALSCVLGTVQAATWPSLALPLRSQGASVGEELRVNGLPKIGRAHV